MSQGNQTERLPLWRLIAGVAVLGCLLLVAASIGPVYIANYELTRYVRALAAQTGNAAQVPDETLRTEILDRAHQLHLPLQTSDVTVKHESGRLKLGVVKYRAQAWHADLHFSGFSTP